MDTLSCGDLKDGHLQVSVVLDSPGGPHDLQGHPLV